MFFLEEITKVYYMVFAVAKNHKELYGLYNAHTTTRKQMDVLVDLGYG